MSLQFIIGSSGAGKTRLLYENLIRQSIEEPDGRFIAIVPEQFTMQTQKEVVALHPCHGTLNIDIVSFQRLAYRIFEELGVEHLEVLDDIGKSMVLRRVVSGQKKNLGVYAGHLNQTGFINHLKSMLSELYQYGIRPEDLRRAREEAASPLLQEKLKDLSVIYEEFQKAIAERFITAEEILDVLCRVLPESKLIKNSVVTLDGYTGFTPVQYRIAELLMIRAKKVVVTVTMDPKARPFKKEGIHHLFYMGKEMVTRLNQTAERHRTERDRDVLLDGKVCRFEESPSIAFIESHLYRYTESADWEPEEVEIYRAVSPGQEVAAAASQIHRLVQEEHIRYREIAVITGDLPGYRYELVNRFQAENIPYFMDSKKSILENVMVEFIRAILEAVARDFDYESMFRFLKTGLVTDNRQELDRLENYVLALGIRGWKRWNSTWEHTYRGGRDLNLKELNAFREQLLSPIEPLRDVLKSEERTVSSMTDGVIACLEACSVKEKLEGYREYFQSRGQYSLAKEYEQVYDRVMELFDRLKDVLGEETVSAREYGQILDAGFGEIQVGVIPATADKVVVGDITRTRLDQIKVLIFIGVNEGVVPSKKERGSLLTDGDREALKNCRIELAPTSREDGLMQRYYLYLMLTKPSKRLILSYVSFDQAGKSKRPSSLVGELCRLFPRLRIRDVQQGRIHSRQEGKEQLILGLRSYGDRKTKFLELYRLFAKEPEYSQLVKSLTEAAFYSYEKKGISQAAARALYGKILQGSVTRLEQYAACAYAHFLQFGLELSERQEYQIAAVDMGNMFHSSIDLCFKELKSQGRSLTDLTEMQRKELAKACVLQVTEQYGYTIFKDSARNKYLAGRIERMTDRTLWALSEQLKKGDFTPSGFEVSFSAIDNLKAMRIRLSDEEEMQLRGRIDRLDVCEDDDHVYVKIIDYKSGGARFDLAAVYYGLQLQLVVYMDAVTELEQRKNPGKQVVPAGVFYYQIKDPLADREEAETPEEIEQQILKQLRMNGLVNSDLEVIGHLDRQIEQKSDVIPVALKNGMIQEHYSSVASTRRFEILREYVRSQLKRSGQEILGGRADAQPYTGGNGSACAYCPYHGVCGFDARIEGCRFRRFPPLKPEQVWQLMGDEAEE